MVFHDFTTWVMFANSAAGIDSHSGSSCGCLAKMYYCLSQGSAYKRR